VAPAVVVLGRYPRGEGALIVAAIANAGHCELVNKP